MSRHYVRKLRTTVLFACVALLCSCSLRAQEANGALTVKQIYGQPGLSGKLNRGLQWSPDGKVLTYFETKGQGKAPKSELWQLEVASGKRALLVSSEKLETVLPAAPAKQSQATGSGRRPASQYQWAPHADGILFIAEKALGWFDIKTAETPTLLQSQEAIADVKFSPDGKFVSFVRNHNLFVVSVADGKERALTTGGTEEVRKGEADWVYPEELDLKTAYWWSPDSSKVAFLEMDESQVSKYPLVDFASFDGDAEEERYPAAGGKNPIVHVYTVSVSGGEPKLMDTGAETNQYLPRVDWLRDSRRVAIQRLNRPQTQLELLLADAETGKSSVLLTEKDAYWINIADDLRFLKDGKRFIWSSERSGYRHLYLYGLDGKEVAQLTDGKWEVTGVEAVDEAKGLIYFRATEKTPIERHLYRVGLDGKGFARITKQDGVHNVLLSPDAGAFVDTYSNAMRPPQQFVSKADGTLLAMLNENKVAELADYHLSPVEFVTVKTHDGMDLNAWVIKPANFDPAKKYPVLVYTYGGPHAQVVMKQWGGATFLWHQLMAQKGFVIFALDNRGSAGRGHLFEEPIHFRFGAQEMSDQRDGAAWLKGQPWVDSSRIGIWGWSYGGHMTLHAMFEDPEDFKAGFAGGPVTDWHYYDTIYTERYIGLLPENEESYQSSSPMEKAGHLKGKLLIAHGTGDDNVHFANTLSLVDKLIELGKSVEVMPFPGRGHGVSDPPARVYLMNRVTQFFVENLGTAH
ncbi:MAG TPA: S9 family peptidase [Candidatus Acidoferrum sp.]|jgi:dipeptidyl-peptidase-4